jgi:hypothetical protein
MFHTNFTKLSSGALLYAVKCFMVKSISAPVSGALSEYKFCGYHRVYPDNVLINQNGPCVAQHSGCFLAAQRVLFSNFVKQGFLFNMSLMCLAQIRNYC